MGMTMAQAETAMEGIAQTAGSLEAAGYIGSMARDLGQIAAAHDLEFLAYLLAMAADEAGAILSDGRLSETIGE